jgi:hypothetical protein
MRRATFPILGIILSTLCFLPIVHADDAITVNRTMDFFVVINVPTLFRAETDLCQGTDDYWCSRPPFQDSVLWLYDDMGNILTVNDDDPRRNGQSWNSFLEIQLEPGVYRLRAGKYGPCDDMGCLHPESPFDEGCQYDLLSNVPLVLDPNPPTASIEPIPSVLPSEEPTVEPSYSPEPTPTETATPTVEPTPTPEPPTPTPSPSPEPTPTPTVEPSPLDSPHPSPTQIVIPSPTAPPPSPTEPPPSPTEPPPSPTEAPPTPTEPPPLPTEPPPPANPVEAVSQAVDAAAKAVGVAISKLTHLGQDLTPTQKAKARPVAVALVISQIASAAAASAASIRKGK